MLEVRTGPLGPNLIPAWLVKWKRREEKKRKEDTYPPLIPSPVQPCRRSSRSGGVKWPLDIGKSARSIQIKSSSRIIPSSLFRHKKRRTCLVAWPPWPREEGFIPCYLAIPKISSHLSFQSELAQHPPLPLLSK